MAYLHILGSGESKAEVANSKGHLFERLVRRLFEALKMTISGMNVSENGKEIDVEGTSLLGRVPFFAECKAQDDALSSPDLQLFGYKFMMKSNASPDLRGFLFTLSPLNPKADEVWRQELLKVYGDRVQCYTHHMIVDLIVEHYGAVDPKVIVSQSCGAYARECGDTQLLCVEGSEGEPTLYWAQLMMSQDGTEPNAVVLYTAKGDVVSETGTVERLLRMKPDLSTTKLACLNTRNAQDTVDDTSPSRSVVRVRMSSDWFDYRLPADPRFFVGRSSELEQIRAFLQEVGEEKTSLRSLLVTGKSGIGKSSLALKARSVMQDVSVVFLPVDSRLCDDVSFMFDAVNELLAELRLVPDLAEDLRAVQVRGLDSLIDTLAEIDRVLKESHYLAVLFFDQFERVFEHHQITRAMRSLLLRMAERRMAIVFGFAWKSDLWSLAEGFPHTERDDIVRESHPIRPLTEFGNEETAAVLKHLESKWGGRLSTAVHTQLTTFCRGLPWLLKKVCAHVLEQKSRGVTEAELIEANLNLQDLFEADLAGLDEEERALLRTMAPLLPATLRRLSESFEISTIDQSLHRFIDKLILVKITEDVGDSVADVKYDAYSDIFREFLITGRVPIDDAYYFYTYPSGSLKFFHKISERVSLSIDDEMAETGKQIASIYNLSRDLRGLGLVNLRNRIFTVTQEASGLAGEELVAFLQSRLKRNRVVSLILSEVHERGSLRTRRLSELLQELFPSVKANEKTWLYYARTTGRWLHESHLAYYNGREESLFDVDNEALFEAIVGRGDYRVGGFRLPSCFRNAIVHCLGKIHENSGVCGIPRLMETLHLSHQSVEKALSDNINLGFVVYEEGTRCYRLTERGCEFMSSGEPTQRKIFKEQCEGLPAFQQFLAHVRSAGTRGIPNQTAAQRVVDAMSLHMAELTVQKLGMILANWGQYAALVARRGRVCYLAEFSPQVPMDLS